MPTSTIQIEGHFLRTSPIIRATYDAVLEAARKLGPVVEEAKKTSIHLVREKAFAGVAVRRAVDRELRGWLAAAYELG